MIKRSALLSIRMTFELLDKLEKKVNEKKFGSISQAIRSYVEVGMYIESCKTMIKVPSFLKSIDELKQRDGLFQWVKKLKDNEIGAIASALKFEKEKRYENGTIR